MTIIHIKNCKLGRYGNRIGLKAHASVALLPDFDLPIIIYHNRVLWALLFIGIDDFNIIQLSLNALNSPIILC